MRLLICIAVSALGFTLATSAAHADDIRVIVGFKGKAAKSVVEGHGGRCRGVVGRAVVATLPARKIAALRAAAAVAYVEEDVIVEAAKREKADNPKKGNGRTKTKPAPDEPTDPEPTDPEPTPTPPDPVDIQKPSAPASSSGHPSETTPWGVARVDAPSTTYTGKGVKVAILDSGIDVDHPDLWANIGPMHDFVGTTAEDGYGHGTHVAGTVAAVDNDFGCVGVAPEATLYVGRVLDDNGSGYASDTAAAIRWATQHEVHVVNMSLGISSNNSAVASACSDAESAGILLIASAGNNGDGSLSTNETLYPASLSSCVAVGATNSSDGLASWSNSGPQLEVSAPGVSIYSTHKGGTYTQKSGTSMASPHAAGIAVLLVESLTVDGSAPSLSTLRTALRLQVRDKGATGRDVGYGYGIVDWDLSNN